MNENDILLDNVSGEVIDYIRQLNFKKSRFGGYDKNYVLLNIQEICNIYERHIKKIFADNKSHIDLLNNEIYDLRQKIDTLSHKQCEEPYSAQPPARSVVEQANRAVAEQANKAIAEANSRIAEANSRIVKLQALYEEAESKLRDQSGVGQVADILSTARLTASDIVKRARDEAEEILCRAKNDADSLARKTREELIIEERAHEDRLNEFRDKYIKCRKYFTLVLEQIKEIEVNLEYMMKKREDVDFEGILTNVFKFSQLSTEKEADAAQDTEPPLPPAKHI